MFQTAIRWNVMVGNTVRIALVGDRKSGVTAHYAIERSFEMAPDIEPVWVPTSSIGEFARDSLQEFNAIWCVPGSPYESEAGAIAAIRYAREDARPFLGTGAGFQHAVLEYVRTVRGMDHASHAENTPGAFPQLISRMPEPLVDQSLRVNFVPGTRLYTLMQVEESTEVFDCSFGLNAEWENLFIGASLRIAARDDAGEVRALELAHHRFFYALLYEPERNVLNGGALHPVVESFFKVARGVRTTASV